MALKLYVSDLSSHPVPRAKSIVREGSALRVFAVRVADVRAERGWSYEQLARVLDVAKTDAYRLCNGGKATEAQLLAVLSFGRRAA